MAIVESTKSPTPSSDASAAVLYVCVQTSRNTPGLAEQRAVEEGHSFADKRQMRIVAEVTDPYDEPGPQKRAGWLRVREMAERGEVTTVITRWPNAISPQHELRYPEIVWLQEHSVRVLFSWPPLSVLGGEDR
jgi:hypothetical protein